ncbi:VOC family protein [Pontixanthobacter sp. CEM42]|uniref:VOC family protein n=1 Tax=Pontixanthobacter sp. CEM42 TaxID=2792077 RepID=UPI001ADEC49E|nr:VOC family protein [Pontixanthobacter sp. CEM42]
MRLTNLRTAMAMVTIPLLAACGLVGGAPEQELDDLIVGVNYVGVSVADVDASTEYYSAAFGVEQIGDGDFSDASLPTGLAPNDFAQARSKLLRSSNAQLRLMSFGNSEAHTNHSAVPVQGPGIMHVCFQAVQDTNAYERALEAGAEPIGAKELVSLSSRNPVKYGYIRDAQGIITEVEEVDVSQLDLPEPPKNKYRMRHVAMATPNLEAMVQFYSAFLGGQEPRRIGNWFAISGENVDKVSGLKDSEIEMAWFQLRNLEIEIAQYHSEDTALPGVPRPLDAPGYNIVMFDVADLDRARQRLLDAGGTIVDGAGSLDGAMTVFGRDPDGNLLGLQQLPESSIYSAKNFDGNGVEVR